MMQRIHAVGLLAAAALLCSSCTPVVVETPTPTPVATLQCHGEFTEETHPCDQAEYDAMAARDAQYEEAERVYTRVTQLMWELRAQRRRANEEMRSLAMNSFLAAVEEELDAGPSSGVVYSGHPEVAWTARKSASDEGSLLALETCLRSGTARASSDGVEVAMPIMREQVFFKSVDGQLKIASSRSAQVESCEV